MPHRSKCILGGSASLAINVARKKLNLDTFLRLILNFQVVSSIPHFFLSIFILVNFEIWIWRENNFKNDWCAMKYFWKIFTTDPWLCGFAIGLSPRRSRFKSWWSQKSDFFSLSKNYIFLSKLDVIIRFAYLMAIEHRNFLKVENTSNLGSSSSFS